MHRISKIYPHFLMVPTNPYCNNPLKHILSGTFHLSDIRFCYHRELIASQMLHCLELFAIIKVSIFLFASKDMPLLIKHFFVHFFPYLPNSMSHYYLTIIYFSPINFVSRPIFLLVALQCVVKIYKLIKLANHWCKIDIVKSDGLDDRL